MNKILIKILFSNILIYFFYITNAQFNCPMKKGAIIIEHRKFDNDKRNPGVAIEGKNTSVFSCTTGYVKDIDSRNGQIRIYIKFDNYFIAYNNLVSLNVVQGQKVQQGQLIGKIKKNERLFLIVSRNDTLIEPSKILPCKIKIKNLK